MSNFSKYLKSRISYSAQQLAGDSDESLPIEGNDNIFAQI